MLVNKNQFVSFVLQVTALPKSPEPVKTAAQSKSKTPPNSTAPSNGAQVDNKPQNKSTATMSMYTSGTYTLTTSHYDKRKTTETKGKSTSSTASASSAVSSSKLAVSGKSSSTPGDNKGNNSAKDSIDKAKNEISNEANRQSSSSGSNRDSTPKTSKVDAKTVEKGGNAKQEGKPKTKAEVINVASY